MRRSLSLFSSILLLSAIACAATIPSGAKLRVRITDDMETLSRGEQFHAELIDDVRVAGKVVLSRGTTFLGEQTQMADANTIQLIFIRRRERDYPIVTSTILVGGSKAEQTNQRRQDAVQAAIEATRGAMHPRPEDLPGSPSVVNGGEVGGLLPQQVLQFKLRKAVEIEEQSPPKKKDLALLTAN